MSFLVKKLLVKCPFWSKNFWSNVLFGQKTFGQMTFGQMPVWSNDFLVKKLFGQMSHLVKKLLVKCHFGQKIFGQMSQCHSSIMMISQFWNLCRACPALDVDKVGSYTAFYYLPVLKCLNKIYFNTGNFDWQKYFISKKLKIFLRSSKKK